MWRVPTSPVRSEIPRAQPPWAGRGGVGVAFISQVLRVRQARKGDSCDSEGSRRIWKVLSGLGERPTLPVTDPTASDLKNLPGA